MAKTFNMITLIYDNISQWYTKGKGDLTVPLFVRDRFQDVRYNDDKGYTAISPNSLLIIF